MATIYQLATCNTCQRILSEFGADHGAEVINIKEYPLTPAQLDHLAELAGSYASLFSRRARKYRSLGLADQDLTEADYRRLLLEEYTFLKRPVVVVGEQVFVGSGKKEVAAAKAALHSR